MANKKKTAMPKKTVKTGDRKPEMEKKIIAITSLFTLLGFIMQIISISTENWLSLELSSDSYKNVSGKILVEINSGIWRICHTWVTSIQKWDEDKICKRHQMFPSEENMKIMNKRMDRDMLDFLRTQTAFSVITILLMFLGHVFAFYTFKRPRYILKRLTALLHLMTAGCILVLNEVFSRSVNYGKAHLPLMYPPSADSSYGASYIVSWLVFTIYLISGLVFLFTSAKRKGEMADSHDAMIEADEPMQLGRV